MSRNGYVKSLELKGICRALSQSNGIDGVMDDIMNMRVENGSWKPMKELEKVFPTDGSTTPYTRIWVHVGNDYKHVFGVLDGSLYWFASIVGDAWQAVEPAKLLCSIEDNDLCHENGNLVTVGGDKFLLWKQGDESYMQYKLDVNGETTDETLSADGMFDFRVILDEEENGNLKVFVTDQDEGYDNKNVSMDGELDYTAEADNVKAYGHSGYSKIIAAHLKENSFYAPFLICTALKTYSGDYVLASRPKLVYPQSYIGSRLEDEIKNAWYTNGGTPVAWQKKTLGSLSRGHVLFHPSTKKLLKGLDIDGVNLYSYPTTQVPQNISKGVSVKGREAGWSNPEPWCRKYVIDSFYYPTLADQTHFVLDSITSKLVFPNHYYFGAKTKLQIRGELSKNIDKDIYQKVCVFATPMVTPYDLYDYDVQTFREYGFEYYFCPRKKKGSDVVKTLKRSNFYKLAEINLTTMSDVWRDVDIESGVVENLVHQEVLQADTTNRDGINARGSYSYNGRLHLYDYDKTQFHGYPLNYFFENIVDGCLPVKNGYDNRIYGLNKLQAETLVGDKTRWLDEWQGKTEYWSWYVGVEIEREDGLCQVVRYAPFQTDAFKLLGGGPDKDQDVYAREFFSLNGCLSYPDSRAKRMFVYLRTSVKNSPISHQDIDAHYYCEFELTPHDRLNMACYISNDLKPIDMIESKNQIHPLPTDKRVTFTEFNTSHHYANGLRVSAVDNPLYLPAEYSYFVGNTGIVGMMANEVAVGTGQTGDAPLMVFTKDGVYGLFVDETGALSYKFSRPIASDVCNNAASIVRVDGGIVFGTERGLCMLKGATAVDIGEICEGTSLDFMNNKFKREPEFPTVVRGAFCHQNIGGFGTITSDGHYLSSLDTKEDFRFYQMGAAVGYDHKEKELIVANDVRSYCYIKDYDGRWRRLSQKVSEVIPCYPDTYVLSEGIVYTLDRFKSEGETRRIWMMTRPINLNTIGYRVSDQAALKENYRVIVRGEFSGASNHVVGIYVLGSLDGKRWAVIGGNERRGTFVDLGCLVERVDVNYLCIVLSGDIGEDGKIDEVLIETNYKRR